MPLNEAPWLRPIDGAAPTVFVNDGLNTFATTTLGQYLSNTTETLIAECRYSLAAVPDPTWDLDGFELPVAPGKYRIFGQNMVDEAFAGRMLVANLTAIKNDVDPREITPRPVATLDIDSGHAGIWIGDKWIITSTGVGDGSYAVVGLFDKTGSCVGVSLDFESDEWEYDETLELTMTRIKARVPDPLSFRSPCRDCGVDLNKIGEGNYLVRRSLPGGNNSGRTGYCISCLEVHLGRELTPRDFVDIPLNTCFGGASARLQQRRGDHLPIEVRRAQFFSPDRMHPLDDRIDAALAKRLFEVLRHGDSRMTQTNGRFTEQVAVLANEASQLYSSEPVADVLGRELDKIRATPDNELKAFPDFADLWYARLSQLLKKPALQMKGL